MCLQFGFLIFWRKDFGVKAAHKMLLKLTPGKPLGFNQMFLSKAYLQISSSFTIMSRLKRLVRDKHYCLFASLTVEEAK
jgi:hypothetical protein